MNHEQSTIYPSFWKPALMGGVTRYYATFCGAVFLLIYVGSSLLFGLKPPVALFVGATLAALAWGFGAIRSKFDPEFFDVYVVKFLKFDAADAADGNRYQP